MSLTPTGSTRQSSIPDYPEHDHQFIAVFYEDNHIDYIFGPFSDRTEADKWARDLNRRYARPGERLRYSRCGVYPVCAAVTPKPDLISEPQFPQPRVIPGNMP